MSSGIHEELRTLLATRDRRPAGWAAGLGARTARTEPAPGSADEAVERLAEICAVIRERSDELDRTRFLAAWWRALEPSARGRLGDARSIAEAAEARARAVRRGEVEREALDLLGAPREPVEGAERIELPRRSTSGADRALVALQLELHGLDAVRLVGVDDDRVVLALPAGARPLELTAIPGGRRVGLFRSLGRLWGGLHDRGWTAPEVGPRAVVHDDAGRAWLVPDLALEAFDPAPGAPEPEQRFAPLRGLDGRRGGDGGLREQALFLAGYLDGFRGTARERARLREELYAV